MRLVLSIAVLMAMQAGAAARVLEDAFIYSDTSCYGRTYGADHLAKHPAQRVGFIYLGQSGERPAGSDIALNFGFRLRDGQPYSGLAQCRDESAGAICYLEGDAGQFRLTLRGKDLQLAVGGWLRLEGAFNMSPDLAIGGDDRVFLLQPAPPDACSPI